MSPIANYFAQKMNGGAPRRSPSNSSSSGRDFRQSSGQAATSDPMASVGLPGVDTLVFGSGVTDGAYEWGHSSNIWVRLASGRVQKLHLKGCPVGWFPKARVMGPNGNGVVSELWKGALQAGIESGLYIQSATKPYEKGDAARTGREYKSNSAGIRTLVATAPVQIVDAEGKVYRNPATKKNAAKYNGPEWTKVTKYVKRGGKMVATQRNVLKVKGKSLALIRRSLALNKGCPVGKQSIIRDDGTITRCSFKPAKLQDPTFLATATADQIYALKKQAAANKKAYELDQRVNAQDIKRYVAQAVQDDQAMQM